ncbi:MAG: hypothetical protein AAGG51_12255 [Cyanobacteria bacterium P01_G01_bin.54]
MNNFIPALSVFLLQLYLLLSWFRSRQKKDGNDQRLCFWGFLLGQLYLLWEVIWIKQTGKPLPGSAAQMALMGRLALGGSLGGVFTILGLFYLSFGNYGLSQDSKQKDKK